MSNYHDTHYKVLIHHEGIKSTLLWLPKDDASTRGNLSELNDLVGRVVSRVTVKAPTDQALIGWRKAVAAGNTTMGFEEWRDRG